MRPIKFKAKTSDGEWVESTSIQNNPFGKTYLMDTKRLVECYNKEVMPSNIWVEIDPTTLCQFTGLTDKNGKEVYEHDIIMTEICLMVIVYVATSASFGAVPLKQFNELNDKSNIPTNNMYWFDNDIVYLSIYGNIHDK